MASDKIIRLVMAKLGLKFGRGLPSTPTMKILDACTLAEDILEAETKELRAKWLDAEARCAIVTRDKRDLAELREAVRLTLEENAHLADGDVCTLIRLKLALQPNPVVSRR